MEVICDRLEEEFESEKQMTRAALRKLISSNIRKLNVFSPGADNGCAKQLLDKLKRCANKYFGSWLEYVKYRETCKRTQNLHIFHYLMKIGKAIKNMNRVSFRYRKNGKVTDKVYTVSTYYLVINGGWYYLSCNTEGKEKLSRYRIDRKETKKK